MDSQKTHLKKLEHRNQRSSKVDKVRGCELIEVVGALLMLVPCGDRPVRMTEHSLNDGVGCSFMQWFSNP
jgi:hypothetical protein